MNILQLYACLDIKTFFKIFLTFSIKKIFLKNSNIYFSQTGEDVLISHFLSKKEGFYIDVGCHHPINKSNTFSLYLKGWKGICIDNNEKMLKIFKAIRCKDITICATISSENKELTYYQSSMTPAVNTVDHVFYNTHKKTWNYDIITKIKTQSLESIISKHLPKNKNIDLLSIDIEGHDFEALKSLNLNLYRPKFIVIETHSKNILDLLGNKIYLYLVGFGYELLATALMNAYFRKK